MKLLGYDLETTGINKTSDRPLQISLVLNEDGVNRIVMNSLVNPLMPIPEGASKIHGIRAQDVRGMPDYLMGLWTMAHLATELQPDYMVSMNGKNYDHPMAIACLGFDPFDDIPQLDILQMAFRYYPELSSRKLSDLYSYFVGQDLEGAHDATIDVMATLAVFLKMRAQIGMSYEELARELDVPKPYSIIPFGKYAGTLIDEVPVHWARFLKSKGDLSPDLEATVNYILAK